MLKNGQVKKKYEIIKWAKKQFWEYILKVQFFVELSFLQKKKINK